MAKLNGCDVRCGFFYPSGNQCFETDVLVFSCPKKHMIDDVGGWDVSRQSIECDTRERMSYRVCLRIVKTRDVVVPLNDGRHDLRTSPHRDAGVYTSFRSQKTNVSEGDTQDEHPSVSVLGSPQIFVTQIKQLLRRIGKTLDYTISHRTSCVTMDINRRKLWCTWDHYQSPHQFTV